MAIPIFILLARDRAAIFRAAIPQILARYGPAISDADLDEFRSTILWYVPDGTLQSDVPDAVEEAIRWAAIENPTVGELRHAGELLESALADDFEAWQTIAKSLKASPGQLSVGHRIREITARSIAHHRRAVRSFADSWPSIPEETEKLRLLDMRSGSFVDLDDAFSRISGMTREQWSGHLDGTIAAGRTGE